MIKSRVRVTLLEQSRKISDRKQERRGRSSRRSLIHNHFCIVLLFKNDGAGKTSVAPPLLTPPPLLALPFFYFIFYSISSVLMDVNEYSSTWSSRRDFNCLLNGMDAKRLFSWCCYEMLDGCYIDEQLIIQMNRRLFRLRSTSDWRQLFRFLHPPLLFHRLCINILLSIHA